MKYKHKIFSATMLVLLSVAVAYTVHAYASISEINHKVIRLHVIANSDSVVDQQLKIKVRNEIIDTFNGEFNNVTTKNDSEHIIVDKINDIRQKAETIVKREGFDYDVNVYYGNYKFPRKMYENIVLPEGYYDALRIEVGNAEGNNWWCVMFPPLCFVDFGKDEEQEPVFDIDTEKRLGEILTAEEIEDIKTKRGLEDIKFKSKIFEFIEKGMVKNTGIFSADKKTVASSTK